MPSQFLKVMARPPWPLFSASPPLQIRTVRHQPYEASFNQDELEEARKWYASFNIDSLPKGHTTYSRSSGPGGQHVNKTESKATSVWPISELSKGMPKLVRSQLKSSRYYSVRNDAISIQAQEQRSRTANTDLNRQKLFDEVHRLFREHVPGATSEETIKKHEAVEKAFQQSRVRSKKHQSAKKASRKGGGHDD
ncbi:peptidyl-tRNA hydrolase domain-containing protein [Nemania sp. FL0916]|nr:peptidyl-tRNA hydrolase domain-containing protein [Nemania sp. FL0916]